MSRACAAETEGGPAHEGEAVALGKGHRLRLKTRTGDEEGDDAEVDSLCEFWASANWMEREVFDMFGVIFKNVEFIMLCFERLIMPRQFGPMTLIPYFLAISPTSASSFAPSAVATCHVPPLNTADTTSDLNRIRSSRPNCPTTSRR